MVQKITAFILTLFITTSALAAKMDFPGREAATVGIAVIRLSDGTMVDSENLQTAMMPASILKAVTSATSLLTVGETFRYITPVDLCGEVNGSVLEGNLTIRGCGDPTINSQHFADSTDFVSEIVDALNQRGISRITGNILIDDGYFSDPGANPEWTISDAAYSYGAGFFGFNFNDNTFRINTFDFETTPEVPNIEIVTEETDSSTSISHGVNSEIYTITGRDVDSPKFTVTSTMNNPGEVFANLLAQRFDSAGIAIDGNFILPTEKPTRLVSHTSPENIEILRSLMFRSDNMMAESALRGSFPGKNRSSCIKSELELWSDSGLQTKYLRILDGCGLARGNRVTPSFMAEVLTQMAKSEYAEAYISLFPKVGKEGTVKNFMKKGALAGKLALKSGSVNGVQCYAGYKLNAEGEPTHAVVIMVNNFFCGRQELRASIQTYLQTLFK